MNGINKELRLAIHPTAIIFLSFVFMLLIPNYPYCVIFFYCTLSIFFTCVNGRENKDIFYSMLLPIRKKDIVKARIQVVCLIEVLEIVFCVPIIFLRNVIQDKGNDAGMDANFALLGFGLILFSVFNYVYFTIYYKNVDKVGKAFIISSIISFLYISVLEVSTHVVPFFRDKLDTSIDKNIGYQMITLAIGIVVFILLNVFAYKKSAKSFEALDL